VPGDLLVRVYADDQIMAQGLGLPQRVRVAEMDHVEAPVAPYPQRLIDLFAHRSARPRAVAVSLTLRWRDTRNRLRARVSVDVSRILFARNE